MAKGRSINRPQENPVVLSHSSELFRDRVQAGRLLGDFLKDELKGRKAVVLGIPRGGVAVAREIAQAIGADLDVVLSRKLGTPGQPELAMGSVSEDGNIFLNDEVVQTLGITSRQIELEKARQMAEMDRRNRLFRKALPKTPLEGRVTIITDDGIATGATMQAALWAARQEKPCTLIVAVPVASAEALQKVAGIADRTICLRQPPMFYAVGQFYARFYQVEDEEVLRILEDEALRRQGRIENRKKAAGRMKNG